MTVVGKPTARLAAVSFVLALALLAGAASGRLGSAAGARVPSSARVLRITWDSTSKRHPGRHSILVTDVAKVRRIAQVVDGLPVATGFCSEGGINLGPPTISFAFLRTPKGRVLAKTTSLNNTYTDFSQCIWTRFSVRGHKRPFLYGGGYLITKAEKILRRTLH